MEPLALEYLKIKKKKRLPCSRNSISYVVEPDNSERHGRMEQHLRLNQTVLDHLARHSSSARIPSLHQTPLQNQQVSETDSRGNSA